jgi:hypothetical protein
MIIKKQVKTNSIPPSLNGLENNEVQWTLQHLKREALRIESGDFFLNDADIGDFFFNYVDDLVITKLNQ